MRLRNGSSFIWGVAAALAAALCATPPAGAEESQTDIHGWIRIRPHISNYAMFNFGQVLPPDKATDDKNSVHFFEQRSHLYITPKLGDYVDGRFAFEIDSRWGDSAYGTGAQAGAGFNADQINIETKNIQIGFRIPDSSVSGTLGVQTIKDPYNGLIMGWSDAAGLTVNTALSDASGLTFGYYRFWQPSATFKKQSEVDFLRFEYAAKSDNFSFGVNLHGILDNTGEHGAGALGGDAFGTATGNGYAPFSYNVSTGHESLVGSTKYTMNVWMPGVNFNANLGAVTLDGFVVYETGSFNSMTDGVSDVSISSMAAQLSAGTMVGGTNLRLLGFYVSGDDSNQSNGVGVKANGFYGPGVYSFAGAWMGLTGLKIAFSDLDATNQDAALIYDPANIMEQQPLGLVALTLTANTPLSDKSRLEAALGMVTSGKNRVVNGSSQMLTEVNAGYHYTPVAGFDLGAVFAYGVVGDFYKVSSAQAAAYNAKSPGADVSAMDPDNMWRFTLRSNYSF